MTTCNNRGEEFRFHITVATAVEFTVLDFAVSDVQNPRHMANAAKFDGKIQEPAVDRGANFSYFPIAITT